MPSKTFEWVRAKKDQLFGDVWGPHTLGVEFVGLNDLSAEVLGHDLKRQGWSNFVRIGSRQWMAARRIAGKPTESYIAWCESELLRIARALPGTIQGIRIWSRPVDYARPSVWIIRDSEKTPGGEIVNLVGDVLPPWEMYARASSGNIEPASCKAVREKERWNLSTPEPWNDLEEIRLRWGGRTLVVTLVLSMLVGFLWVWSILDHFQQQIMASAASNFWVQSPHAVQELGTILILATAVAGILATLSFTAVTIAWFFPYPQWREMWKRGLGTWRGFEGQVDIRVKKFIRINTVLFFVCFAPCILVFIWVLVRTTEELVRETIENPVISLFALGFIIIFSVTVWVFIRLATVVKQTAAKVVFGGGGIFIVFGVLTAGPGWVYQQGLSLPFYTGILPPGAQLGSTAYVATIIVLYGFMWWATEKITSRTGPVIPIFVFASIAFVVLSVLAAYIIGLWQIGSDFVRNGEPGNKLSATYPVSACLITDQDEQDRQGEYSKVWILAKDGSDILYIPLTGGVTGGDQEVIFNTASTSQITKFSNFPETLGKCSP